MVVGSNLRQQVSSVHHPHKSNALSLFFPSNIEASDWIRLATEIELNYATFDAFIVLHGTDTIWYILEAIHELICC